MKRRAFLELVRGSLLAAPLAAEAQPVGMPARVGFLTPSSRLAFASGERRVYREAFSGRLGELGWTEGQNLVIEGRYAEGAYDRLQALAVELVSLPVDVIFANSAPAALAAKRATRSVPIVFETLGEPISGGLVSSLARPERNLTGISGLGPELSGKRLELLRELVPGLRRVALLVNPKNVMSVPTLRETEKAGAILRLRIEVLEVRSPDQLEGAIGGVGSDGATAMIIVPDPILLTNARRIQALLLKHRLPAVHAETGWLQAGGLMLFGSSLLDHFRQAATLVDKILRGARVADLPVEQSTRFELVINLKTAKALGLTIPPSLLVRADQVIDP
jgi:putative tryptophan/tyrosine transport system substrate-binding protein